MALLLLHFPPRHYYPQAAPPPMTAGVFESENLQGDNVLRPVLGAKRKITFFPHPETNDTRGV